ncbi:MAG: aminopeptidase P N-terminal domain-containing protein [Acholeplasmatales bacterium]|jgi:Xaa-Pro aminopeptidase|nr:aminopeptidase P N-terminal domain-containing protein [Acholeplasmatales bacterium]
MENVYQKRRIKLLNSLNENSLIILYSGDEIVRSEDQNYPFSVNNNFYYLTGINEAQVYLAIIKTNGVYQEFLFLRRIDPEIAKWVGSSLAFSEASRLSGINISNIFNLHGFESFIKNSFVANRKSLINKVSEVYLDSSVAKASLRNLISQYLVTIKDVYPLICNARRIKDQHEIGLIKEAIHKTYLGLYAIRGTLKSAKNERDIEAMWDYSLKCQGVKRSFETIIGSGVNATTLHYVKNNAVLDSEDLVLCDLGVEYEKYASDITRTYPISGKFSNRQKEIYNIVLKANVESIKFLKAGVSYQEFLDFGKNILINECLKIDLIRKPEEINEYYWHGLGHFLGLDVHDVGSYNEPLQAGMVITVEPGLYIASEGIGIRIEDDVLITSDGSINLSQNILKEIKDIEF